MKKFILSILLFLCIKAQSQVNGFAYLNGQTIHSGIKVKFIANSPTAITDSTYTDQFGYYYKNISGGIYSIQFSYQNYQPVNYNNNVTSILTNTSVLNPVTLYYGTVVNISGNVFGNWTKNNIYLVNSDIVIPQNNTLTIEPGTVIKFNGKHSLTANGCLEAIGNQNSKILFTSNNSNPSAGQWKGIYILNNQTIIKNSIIEFVENSIQIEYSSPIFEENEVRFFTYGINLNNNSKTVIKNNSIHDFNSYEYGTAIYISNCNTIVECNTIYNGAARGILVSDGSTIKNNLIYNIKAGVGITGGYNSNARIENNIVHHCYTGINSGRMPLNGSCDLILNNTVYGNTIGIHSQSHPLIVSNLVINNISGTNQDASSSASPLAIAYNLVWNNSKENFGNCYIPGVGQIVNTNANGTPVDSYFNISVDPLFVNNVAPILSSSSPCFGAGDPTYASYIGCNTSLMCSSIVLNVKKLNFNANIKSFPNPNQGIFTLSNLKKTEALSINLFDMSGKKIIFQLEETNENELILNIQNVVPGIYILEISNPDSQKSFLKIIKE